MSASYPYLGSPGAMIALPHPNGAFDNPESRGEQTFDLLSGGVGVRRRLAVKRSWSLPYMSQQWGDGIETLLRSFYLGLYGSPLVYVDPSTRNVLGLDVSTVGIRPQASHGWSASAGAVALDGTQTSPVAGSAVLKWTPSAGGTLSPTLNILTAPVMLPSEYVAVSLYAKAGSAKSTTLAVQGFLANGSSLGGDQATVTASLTTSWQRFTVVASPGLFGPYVLPTLTLASGSANIWIAGAQLEYGSSASSWQPGFGSPRVRITGSMGRTVPLYGQSTHTLNLAEV